MKKIAIIGAGASGLPAIKCCLDEGLQPVCFERTEDIGGLWNWKETPTDGRSTVMKSTIINTSKEMSFYSDFLVPDDYPNFMHNKKVLSYFRLYAENFDLNKYIHLRTEVKRVSQVENFKDSGRWKLEIKDLESGLTRAEEFDGVMVSSGHHAEKKMPNFQGQEEFEGKIVHSHDYTDYRGYEGKRVIVVGIGNSGVDVAVELSKISDQVYLSTRRGAWIIKRVSDNGLPFDCAHFTRFENYLTSIFPSNLVNSVFERWLNNQFDHELFGLKPEHRFTSQHPTISDDLPNRLIAGNVIVKSDIRRLNGRSVEFEDGSVADNIDAIICCTGYLFGFPFIDHKAFEVKNNEVNLYKYAFPPDLSPSTIAVIGCFQTVGGIMPMSEMQCRWVTRVFKRELSLPSSQLMWADIREKRDKLSNRYVKSTRHTMQVDLMPFMDEIAELCGCKPDLYRLFLTDPKLAYAILFGPSAPTHYRVKGHGAWPGARNAILTIMDRVAVPLQTRKPPKNGQNYTMRSVFFIVLAIALCFLAIYMWQ